MKIHEDTFSANGVKLGFKYISGRGSTLVFLHGGTGSLSAWKITEDEFRALRQPLLYLDTRGCGKSSRPLTWQEYSLENHIKDVIDTLNKFKLQKVVLIGHCQGAMIGAGIALQKPELVSKLILINPPLKHQTMLLGKFCELALRVLYPGLNLFCKYSNGTGSRVDYNKFIGTPDFHLGRIFADYRACGLRSVLNQFRAICEWDDVSIYSKINIPTLIIAGSKDTIAPSKLAVKLSKLITGSKLVILKTSHTAPINAGKRIVNVIVTFINT